MSSYNTEMKKTINNTSQDIKWISVNLEDEQKKIFKKLKKVLFKFRVKVGCYIC